MWKLDEYALYMLYLAPRCVLRGLDARITGARMSRGFYLRLGEGRGARGGVGVVRLSWRWGMVCGYRDMQFILLSCLCLSCRVVQGTRGVFISIL